MRSALEKVSSIEARISAVLLEVEPLLRIEQCSLQLVKFSVESGAAVIGISGGCPDCEMSPATFSPAIKAHIMRRIPEVREVTIAAASSINRV